MNAGALPDRAFGPDPPMMALDDPLDDRQPDAGAVEFAARMKALKNAAQLARITRMALTLAFVTLAYAQKR